MDDDPAMKLDLSRRAKADMSTPHHVGIRPPAPRAGLSAPLLLALVSPAFACNQADDNCVALGERADALHEDAHFNCGVNYEHGNPFAHEIATCLAEQLNLCKPAFGSFLARPPGNERWATRFVFIDDACEATLLVLEDPDAPNAVFTEFKCALLVATGDESVIAWSMCGEKIEYPYCTGE